MKVVSYIMNILSVYVIVHLNHLNIFIFINNCIRFVANKCLAGKECAKGRIRKILQA